MCLSHIKVVMVCCCFSLQTPYLAKFLASFGPKCSQPIKLQDCLTINLSRIELWVILIFSVHIVIPESKKPRLPFRKSVAMNDYLPIWLQYFLLKIWLVWKFSVEKGNKWGEYLIVILWSAISPKSMVGSFHFLHEDKYAGKEQTKIPFLDGHGYLW